MKLPTDEQLVRDVQGGSVLSFETLVRRYQQRVFAFVRRIVRDEDASSDVTQETFISLYKTIDRVDAEKKFSSYLFTIARNAAYSYLRSRRHDAPLSEAETIPSRETVEGAYERREHAARIRRAVSAIDRRYKAVISLYYFDDLSYEQISKKLSIPINTVRTHLKRGKAILRQLLRYEKS